MGAVRTWCDQLGGDVPAAVDRQLDLAIVVVVVVVRHSQRLQQLEMVHL